MSMAKIVHSLYSWGSFKVIQFYSSLNYFLLGQKNEAEEDEEEEEEENEVNQAVEAPEDDDQATAV
jgi:hypothetical protein